MRPSNRVGLVRMLLRGVKSLRSAQTSTPQLAWTRGFAGKPVKITDEQRNNLAKQLPTWKMVNGKDAIQKSFQFADFNQSFPFADFNQAFAFMARVAYYCNEVNHHPEWLNKYNKIDVTLTTHDCNGLSQNDIDMATNMDSFATEVDKVHLRFNAVEPDAYWEDKQ
eukprot:g70945.t1